MRILVVEDDRKVASFLERGLREEGYAVDVAHDGVDGSLKAHVYDYDLLVLDVMLPGRRGSRSCGSSAGSSAGTPVLLLTARDSKEDVVRGLDAGADDYLTKPFSFDELPGPGPGAAAAGRRRPAGAADLRGRGAGPAEAHGHAGGQDLNLTPKESSCWSTSCCGRRRWCAGRSCWRRCGTSSSTP
jgi:CheY-like chemotaxis protein